MPSVSATGLSTLMLADPRQTFRAPTGARPALVALLVAGMGVFLLASDGEASKLVGAVPSGPAGILADPNLVMRGCRSIFMDAVGLVIVTFTSGMLTARSFATAQRLRPSNATRK